MEGFLSTPGVSEDLDRFGGLPKHSWGLEDLDRGHSLHTASKPLDETVVASAETTF